MKYPLFWRHKNLIISTVDMIRCSPSFDDFVMVSPHDELTRSRATSESWETSFDACESRFEFVQQSETQLSTPSTSAATRTSHETTVVAFREECGCSSLPVLNREIDFHENRYRQATYQATILLPNRWDGVIPSSLHDAETTYAFNVPASLQVKLQKEIKHVTHTVACCIPALARAGVAAIDFAAGLFDEEIHPNNQFLNAFVPLSVISVLDSESLPSQCVNIVEEVSNIFAQYSIEPVCSSDGIVFPGAAELDLIESSI